MTRYYPRKAILPKSESDDLPKHEPPPDIIIESPFMKYLVHKDILAAHSNYFARAISNGNESISVKGIRVTDATMNVMLEAFYWGDYKVSTKVSVKVITCHARAYWAGLLFEASDLKASAFKRIRDYLDSHCHTLNLYDFVKYVYSLKLKTTDQLRILVVTKFRKSQETLQDELWFVEALQQVPCFASDLLRAELASKEPKKRKRLDVEDLSGDDEERKVLAKQAESE